FDQRIAKSVDPDGDGPQPPRVERFVYDRDQIDLIFDGNGSRTHRYLYGPAVDQVLADEDIAGDVHWLLADNLGSIRDVTDSVGAAAGFVGGIAAGALGVVGGVEGASILGFAAIEGGTAATLGTAIVTEATAAAAGDFATQEIAVALGWQREFSYKQLVGAAV